MKIAQHFLRSFLQTSSLMIPAPFCCPGCGFCTWEGVCQSCIRATRRNSDVIPSSTESIAGFVPLVYSFQQTHSLLKHWKEHRGSKLQRLLFNLSPELKQKLQDQEFDFIVPIPQSFERSWRRGHASATTVAKFFSQELQVPILSLLELKNENTPKQASLSQIERDLAPNPFRVSEVALFLITNPRHPLKLLIVDDLITSGNTLIRAAEEIKEALPHSTLWAGSLGYRPKKKRPLPEATTFQKNK